MGLVVMLRYRRERREVTGDAGPALDAGAPFEAVEAAEAVGSVVYCYRHGGEGDWASAISARIERLDPDFRVS